MTKQELKDKIQELKDNIDSPAIPENMVAKMKTRLAEKEAELASMEEAEEQEAEAQRIANEEKAKKEAEEQEAEAAKKVEAAVAADLATRSGVRSTSQIGDALATAVTA